MSGSRWKSFGSLDPCEFCGTYHTKKDGCTMENFPRSALLSEVIYRKERFEEAKKELAQKDAEIARLNAYIKELRQESIETDKMFNMDTSALHKAKE
jgi:hypothetical protein